MKAALYLRVSTTEQNVDNQLPALEAYANSRGWQIVETYRENESAWRAGHQRELAWLLADIRGGKRKYDVLLIWALDRLSRQGIGPLLQLINSFEVYGCHAVSVNENWTHPDAGPMREMFIAMSAWAAKFESDRRSERTKAGLARAIANGKKLGRPAGKKDKGKRKRTGYLLRYANKR